MVNPNAVKPKLAGSPCHPYWGNLAATLEPGVGRSQTRRR